MGDTRNGLKLPVVGQCLSVSHQLKGFLILAYSSLMRPAESPRKPLAPNQ